MWGLLVVDFEPGGRGLRALKRNKGPEVRSPRKSFQKVLPHES
jgi:hypothetical protein